MKIGIAQINTTVGDLKGNQSLILAAYDRLVKEGADLILFPELAVCGYPPRDLLLKSRFSNDVADTLNAIASRTKSIPALIGTVESRANEESGRPLYNSIAWCENGTVQHFARKCLLPNYDVFDEERYFEPSKASAIQNWNGLKIGLTICEDIWTDETLQTSKRYEFDPIKSLENKDLDLLINLSASPWHINKETTRTHLIQTVSKRLNCPVIYCNAVGGNDELIFDGSSFITDQQGSITHQLPSFQSSLQVLEIETSETTPLETDEVDPIQKTHDALVLGLRDYAHKSQFKKGLLGLSGGIDSAVVAALAVKALGSENVIGIAMPSEISSEHSLKDAEALAKNLGIEFQTIPIKDTYNAVETSLEPSFLNYSKDVTEENIQARIRGLLLMALSNKYGALLLTTGNKSEIAVGYCTLYGDMCGGLAVISDVPKMSLVKYNNVCLRSAKETSLSI